MNLFPKRWEATGSDPVLRRLGRRLKRILRPGTLILGYHRVIDLPSDPYSTCVPPHLFDEHLRVIRAYANPIPLRRLAAMLHTGRLPRRSVVITFDDGYFDALAYAKPLLARYDVPATVFAISGFIGGSRELWWDELARFFDNAAGPEFDRTYRQAHEMTPEERAALLASLRKAPSETMTQRDAYRALSAQELRTLADGGLIEVGAHTVTHPSLPKLGREEQRKEIRNSRAQLESILERPVTAFSYPHGRAAEETLAEVRAAGFSCACSSHVDVARASSPIFRLPRVQAHAWSGDEFHERLRFWFEGN